MIRKLASGFAEPKDAKVANGTPEIWGAILITAFVLTCAGFSILPLVNAVRKPLDNKDYSRWYEAGRHVIEGRPLYEAQDGRGPFDFVYPPFAAVGLFAPPSLLGPTGVVVAMTALTSLAWLGSLFLAVRLYTGRWVHQELLLYLVPGLIALPYTWDIFFLGPPIMILLGLLMLAFLALEQGRRWLIGLALATAAALKAFPIVLLGYLVWRRQCLAALWTVVFLAGLLWLLPGAVRGFQRNNAELVSWFDAMIMKQSSQNIAQQPQIAFQWRNQSLLSTVHRLTRHVAVGSRVGDGAEQFYVNLVDLGPKGSNLVFYALMGLMGLTFAAVTWGPRGRTPQSRAMEYALALGLVLFATPKAGTYYFVWLLLPLTTACAFIQESPARSQRRRTATGLLAISVLLLSTAATQPFDHTTQAYGATTWGGLAVWCSVLWMYCGLRREERRATTQDPITLVGAHRRSLSDRTQLRGVSWCCHAPGSTLRNRNGRGQA